MKENSQKISSNISKTREAHIGTLVFVGVLFGTLAVSSALYGTLMIVLTTTIF
jgi:hypothetical protein